MLYHLSSLLQDHYSWINVFRYQTFRAMCAFLLAFVFVLILEPVYIRKLKAFGIKGQPIRDDGPKDHDIKQGTPTMGGLVIVAAVCFSALLLCDLSNLYVWLSIFVLLSFSAIGFVDDWRKISLQNSKGLAEGSKLLWQFGVAAFVTVILLVCDFSSIVYMPFLKDISFELGIVFVLFSALVIVGSSNAVNLTDGLDGLAIGPVMTVAATYAVFSYLTGNIKAAEYLGIEYVAGAGELSIILSAIVASGLGFLWYNTFPAQVFMGDLGALALGAILGLTAVLVKQEIILVLAGGIFVLEALSVIIQRTSYKFTKRRVFRMAPIHHHFELKGWAEPKIIVRFWIISIVLALLSLTSLKLR